MGFLVQGFLMIFPFYLSPHQRALLVFFPFFHLPRVLDFSFWPAFPSIWKQKQRQTKIDSLSSSCFAPPSQAEHKIHALSLSQLVTQCRSGVISPSKIVLAYAKKAIRAHQATNCLSDIMFTEALTTPPVANWASGVDSESTNETMVRDRPLMGVPVSIKGVS